MQLSTDLLNVAVGSATALITLLVGALVWRQTSRHFRHARSASYIERFNSSDYFSARVEVDRVIAADPEFESLTRADEAKLSTQLQRDRLHVLMFANLFQEIGAAYRVGLVEPHYTWSVFGFLAQHYWQKLSPFILWQRAKSDRRTLYQDFEYLCFEMGKLDRKYASRNDPVRDRRANYLFAYGSLMSPESYNRTARSKAAELFKKAKLCGFERGWFAFSSVELETGDGPEAATMAFLGIRPSRNAHCNGVLIPIQKHDLTQLDQREKGYKRIDITPLVFPSTGGRVFTYTVEDVAGNEPAAVVAAEYVEGVERAAALYGHTFLQEYLKTTAPHGFEVRNGGYRFSDPAQNTAAGRNQ